MVSSAEVRATDPPRNIFKQLLLRTSEDYLLGIALLLVVVFLWTASGFVTQTLYAEGYKKPFFITYLNTSSFTFYLLPFLCRYWWRRQYPCDNILQGFLSIQYQVLPTSDDDTVIVENQSSDTAHPPSISSVEETDPDQLAPLTTHETARLASYFCFLWFIANWTLNAALDFTSVASCTVLSSTSSFFTLTFGLLFAVESLTPTKVVAVITRFSLFGKLSFIGVLLVSLADNSSPMHDTPEPVPVAATALYSHKSTNPLLGDILAVASAMGYAIYVILLKVRIRSESRIDMQLFFGFVGAINIVSLLPLVLILHITGYEQLELPPTRKAWGAVFLNMFITLSSDYLYVLAMLKTTPVVVTVGLSLTIPLAIVGDEILNTIHTTAQAGLGALLVFISFGLVGWENGDTIPQKIGGADPDPLQDMPHDALIINQSGRREGSAG